MSIRQCMQYNFDFYHFRVLPPFLASYTNIVGVCCLVKQTLTNATKACLCRTQAKDVIIVHLISECYSKLKVLDHHAYFRYFHISFIRI